MYKNQLLSTHEAAKAAKTSQFTVVKILKSNKHTRDETPKMGVFNSVDGSETYNVMIQNYFSN